MRKGKSSGFLGVFLVAAGLFLVLNNTGLVDFPFWEYFGDYWPVGLVIAGVAIIYKRRDVGFAVLALTLIFLLFYGMGQAVSGIFSGNWWVGGVGCVSGSGNVTSETRALFEFSEVSVSGGVNVYLDEGAEADARVEAEDNIVGLVRTEVRGDKLFVSLDSCVRNSKPVNVYVTFGEIERLEAQSAGRIVGRSPLEGKDIRIESSSAGDIDVEVDAVDVTLGASSAGSVTVRGGTDNLYADASSSGRIDAFSLVAKDVRAGASSAGVVQVYASDELTAEATSGGKVEYKGDAKVDEETSSAGVVRKAG